MLLNQRRCLTADNPRAAIQAKQGAEPGPSDSVLRYRFEEGCLPWFIEGGMVAAIAAVHRTGHRRFGAVSMSGTIVVRPALLVGRGATHLNRAPGVSPTTASCTKLGPGFLRLRH
jgi:hypothetical protein